MANHKYINQICIIIAIVTVIIAFVFSYYGEAIGLISSTTADLTYVAKLFDDSKMHEVNIEISEDDWNTLQDNAADKDYQICAVTVDGEKMDNVGIRAKGNSSLSSVASTDSERYSLKIEFDHYSDGETYYGLDKLNLNNVVADNTYLKDYLTYDMMDYMGVDAPLTSFVKVSVNGEYFGLYLAVEGIEDAFAQRNYGSDTGNIYKPDSMDINAEDDAGGGDKAMPDMTQTVDGTQTADGTATADTTQRPTMGQPPNGAQAPAGTTQTTDATTQTDTTAQTQQMPDMSQITAMGGGGMTGGNASTDVALIYTDDEISSYENIWDGAVFDVTTSDKETLIDSIKQLNEGKNLEDVVDVEEVLKYFVVHSFVDNYDSYTGSMMHNYYLREVDGQLSIIPWDYNLAFSAFSGGGMGGGAAATTATASTDEATTLVNYAIDTPVSGTTMEERPFLNELLSNEKYLTLYHQYYDEFMTGYFDSGRCQETIDKASALISADVKDDPTAFCTYEEYENGVAVLKQFCDLRVQSINGQLDGTIPSTTTGQTEQPDTLIDASAIDITAMGSNLMGGGMTAQNAATTQTGVQPITNTITQDTSGSSENTTTGTADTIASTTNATKTGGAPTTPDNKTTNWNMSTIILLAASGLLLVGGILVTRIYKR